MRWPNPISRSPRASALVDPWLDALARADRVEHFQHRLRRAAMQRPGQRAIAGGDGANRSAWVEATTRVVKVEAFIPWSHTVTK